jgi:hypothetical protein
MCKLPRCSVSQGRGVGVVQAVVIIIHSNFIDVGYTAAQKAFTDAPYH